LAGPVGRLRPVLNPQRRKFGLPEDYLKKNKETST